MTQDEVARLKDTFDNSLPIVPDNRLFHLIGQAATKNLVDLCAEGPEQQTISQINLIYRSLKDCVSIAGTSEIVKHCLSQVQTSIQYDWSSAKVFVSYQHFVSMQSIIYFERSLDKVGFLSYEISKA